MTSVGCGWAGTREGGWESIILTVTHPLSFVPMTKRPISAGVQASAKHGELHSQPASVNNVPNNYVTVFGLPHEKVTPPSPDALQYANGGSGLRTGSSGDAVGGSTAT